MKNLLVVGLATLGLFVQTVAAEALPVNLSVPSGFVHKTGRGIDKLIGTIENANGLVVSYELGRIPKSGQSVLSGKFKNRAVVAGRAPGAKWLKEEVINGFPAYLACDASGMLFASFPTEGVNLSARVANPIQSAEALAIFRTFGRADPSVASLVDTVPSLILIR